MTVDQQTAPGATPQIPAELPVLPLRGGMVVFPLAVVPLAIGQERSVRLVDDVMRDRRMLLLVSQRDPEQEQPGPDDVNRIGTVGVIHQLMRAPDGVLRLVVQGLERAGIEEFTATEPYLKARVQVQPDVAADGVEAQALRHAVIDLFRRVVALMDEVPNELVAVAEGLSDPRQVAYLAATAVPFEPAVRQELLEIDPVDAKLRRLVDLLQHELAVRELGRKITSDTQERMSKAQREYVLREQLRAIQRELGEGEESNEAQSLRAKIDEANLPDEARREAERELSRLASVPPASPEYGIIRTYLDWLATLPWRKYTGGVIDVPHARQVLDEDHYDLDKIKERILEYLAVKKLREERLERERAAVEQAQGEAPASNPVEAEIASREPILCFVGPPGVGKTSLGLSIARALGRKFVRISLGGVHDEAEIRGHRRTYIGALPGRIIQGIKRVETADPVFILDEIDKVGADWRGDPSSALLEVLDPAQNSTFVDNYLGVPFDLSKVLFITTANNLDTIPPPLRDRMEILMLAGYTDQEKVRIAATHLVPKQLRANGLVPEELSFEDEALLSIVRGYTREAGVRSLDREIGSICRKAARRVAEGHTEPRHVTPALVETFLGRPRFFDEAAERTSRPGVATGLAWTPVGGDVLFVEAAAMPSQEEHLLLTGMLGDVMRESAQTALSFVRSDAARLGVDPRFFEARTIHVHVPAGAVPKDGPSAGVTIVTAIASLATSRPVRSDVAMTGEITLRGKVLPVGGIKEKVLAAHRSGLRTIILPRRNERDLEDIPPDVRSELTFVLADAADQVVDRALEPQPVTGSPATPGDVDHTSLAARSTSG
ncbi:MAG: endopeptidase La [Chloroflexi bacterium]|nr:endopeptidase La [Chloroflexota bacterium]